MAENWVAWNLSFPSDLKAQVKRVPLPEGVTWSDVFQVFCLVIVADKKGASNEEIRGVIRGHKYGEVIREWLRDIYGDFLESW